MIGATRVVVCQFAGLTGNYAIDDILVGADMINDDAVGSIIAFDADGQV